MEGVCGFDSRSRESERESLLFFKRQSVTCDAGSIPRSPLFPPSVATLIPRPSDGRPAISMDYGPAGLAFGQGLGLPSWGFTAQGGDGYS